MDEKQIDNLPHGFKITQGKWGWSLWQGQQCLTCRQSLEETFSVMCKFHTWQQKAKG